MTSWPWGSDTPPACGLTWRELQLGQAVPQEAVQDPSAVRDCAYPGRGGTNPDSSGSRHHIVAQLGRSELLEHPTTHMIRGSRVSSVSRKPECVGLLKRLNVNARERGCLCRGGDLFFPNLQFH